MEDNNEQKESEKNIIQNENNDQIGIPKRSANSLYRTNALIPKNKKEKEEEEEKEMEKIEEKEKNNESKIYLPIEIDELESDEENDTPPKMHTKQENYTVKNMLVPKFSFNELTQPQLTKIYELKVQTEEEIAKTVKNKKSSNLVKALVSKKKNRFCYDGFDLDLTYITSRIIAMGFPSTKIEGLYRNPMEEVQRFLNTRHPSHYKVYNLCIEKTYPQDTFYKQACFPFRDHEAPPINLIIPFCEDAKKFLDEDENNIIAVHCKAGKGRTGTFICCLLLYMNVFKTIDECLQYYGMMRVENGKGVTIPSQIRYINYFEIMLKNNMEHPIIFVKKNIKRIRMFTMPMFHKAYTPNFTIQNNDKIYNSGKKKTIVEGEGNDAVFDFDIDEGFIVEGDVQVTFYKIHILGKKESIFKFWFNSNFIPYDSNVYEFKKKYIDKACKDTECKYFKDVFKIEVHFSDI